MSTNVILKREPVNSNRLKVAHKALRRIISRPKFFIEDADINGGIVSVIYINEELLNSGLATDDDWKECEISADCLTVFINDRELNTYEFNSSDNDGCHVQESGVIPMDYYLKYNLNVAVKAYIEAGKDVIHV